MKRIGFVGIIAVTAFTLVGTVSAQKRTSKRPAAKPVPVKAVLPPLDVRVGKQSVENQLSNVMQLVDKIGPIAQALEDMETSARSGRISQAAVKKHNDNKQRIVVVIRGLRDGLSVLETDFRTKADLKKYLLNIEGITEMATMAEDSAIAGRFVAAKDPLRDVAKKLMDTLAALPKYNTALN